MNSIILKTSAYSIFLCVLSMIIFSCTKSHTSTEVLERVDTVKYEAILNNYTNDWCVNSINMATINQLVVTLTGYRQNSDSNYYIGECNLTQNQVFIFTVNKYVNKSIPLAMNAYNQWYNTPPYPDSIVTLNIYLNDTIVATQNSRQRFYSIVIK